MAFNEIVIAVFAVLLVIGGIGGLLNTLGSKARMQPPRCEHCGTRLVDGSWCPVCDQEARADTRSLDGHGSSRQRHSTSV